MTRHISEHLRDVRAGGWRVLFRKAKSFATLAPSLMAIVAFAPVVLLVTLFRPLILVRFGTMRSDRLGHFICDIEAYLCVRDLESPRRRVVDIIGCPHPACNAQVEVMWKRTLRITPGGQLWNYLDAACSFWTRTKAHHIRLSGLGDYYKLISNSKPHLRFTDTEMQRAQELLKQLGIPPGSSWVCIHNRDSLYLDPNGSGRFSYHDYRNFSIASLVKAAEELVRRGYFVVRMGSVVSEKLTSNDSRVIDYASSAMRSEFADTFLLAECSAYIGSDSGIACVPFVFRKPVSYVNFSSSQIDAQLKQGLRYPFIFKRLWHKEKQRFLSIRETFEAGLGHADMSHQFEDVGVEPVCNTPEEILELAMEIDDRLRARWQPQAADEDLQRRFWEIFGQHSLLARKGDINARIGAAFLLKHKDLIN